VISFSKLIYPTLLAILALSFSACSTLTKPSDKLILPNLVSLALNEGDKIIDCVPPENLMLGNNASHTCVQMFSKNRKNWGIRFRKYLEKLEINGWHNEGHASSHNNPLKPSYKYLYLTKEFPDLGGKRELFILPKPAEGIKYTLLIFESTNSVIGEPDCDEQNEQNR